MATKITKEKPKEEIRYLFLNEDCELYESNYTNEQFTEDVRVNGESQDNIYYRVPMGLLEKIKVESKITIIK